MDEIFSTMGYIALEYGTQAISELLVHLLDRHKHSNTKKEKPMDNSFEYSPSANRLAHELEWYTLFEVLLHNTDVDFQLSTQGNKGVIRSTEEGTRIISERLTTALGTASNFRFFLPYEIGGKKKPEQLQPINRDALKIPLPEDSVDAGIEVFNKIFSVALKKMRFLGFFDEDSSSNNNRVLWSEPVEDYLKPVWLPAIKAAVATFHETNIDVLRAAWNGDKSGLKAPSGKLDEHVIAQGLLQESIGFLDDKDETGAPRTRIFFDYGHLHSLLSLPDMDVVEAPSESDQYTHEIAFDLAHFTTCLQMLLEDGVVLRVYKDRHDAVKADPLFITARTQVHLQNLYVFVLDRSGSMSGDLHRLKEEVAKYVVETRERDPEARIRIVPFPDGKPLECSISEATKLSNYISSIDCQGGTPLFSTVENELSYLQQISKNHRQNIRMIVFTDGGDTSNNKWHNHESSVSSKIVDLNQTGTLQILPIGAGTSVDQKCLASMASTCSTGYTYFNSTKDLTGVFSEASSNKPVRKLEDFVAKLRTLTHRVTIALPQDGDIHMPHVSFVLAPNEQVVLEKGGKTALNAKLLDLKDLPDEKLVDQLRHFKRRATNIAADTTFSLSQRIRDIENLLSQVASLPTSRESENQLVANVKYDIQVEIVHELRKAQQGSGHAASAMTRLGAITEVTQHLTQQREQEKEYRSEGQNSNN